MINAAKTILMIEPVNFGFNEVAFETNKFQQRVQQFTPKQIQSIALLEFKNMVRELKQSGIEVIVYADKIENNTPDSIFPNNWWSTHPELCVTYPMEVKNRRNERREDIISDLRKRRNYKDILRLEGHEANNSYLEGTGSIVFDHTNQKAYAAISPRTHSTVLHQLCKRLDYTPVEFEAYGGKGELIYHTNVMMFVGETFIAIGITTVAKKDQNRVISSIEKTDKEILFLHKDQVYNSFAGNMIQLRNDKEETVLVMSETAYDSLDPEQLTFFKKHNDHLVSCPIHMIETIGGGSTRCMIAELF